MEAETDASGVDLYLNNRRRYTIRQAKRSQYGTVEGRLINKQDTKGKTRVMVKEPTQVKMHEKGKQYENAWQGVL